MQLKNLFAVLTVSIALFGCSKKHNPAPKPELPSVTIGTQVWTKYNLDVDHYKNGDAIPEVKDFNVWKNLKTGAWHYYNNDTANGRIYGKLYNWYAVNDPRGLAPAGWHVPSDAEWTKLTDYLGGEDVAGGKIKEAGTALWIAPNTAATNSSGFSALPAGTSTSLIFWQKGYNTYWWTTTLNTGSAEQTVWFRAVFNNTQHVHNSATTLNSGFSVRCVKD